MIVDINYKDFLLLDKQLPDCIELQYSEPLTAYKEQVIIIEGVTFRNNFQDKYFDEMPVVIMEGLNGKAAFILGKEDLLEDCKKIPHTYTLLNRKVNMDIFKSGVFGWSIKGDLVKALDESAKVRAITDIFNLARAIELSEKQEQEEQGGKNEQVH